MKSVPRSGPYRRRTPTRRRPPLTDYRELVIVQLADERAEFEAKLISVLADSGAYRDLVLAALAIIAALLAKLSRLQERYCRLLDAYRQERLRHRGAA